VRPIHGELLQTARRAPAGGEERTVIHGELQRARPDLDELPRARRGRSSTANSNG